jgi:ankyrin repeat protein
MLNDEAGIIPVLARELGADITITDDHLNSALHLAASRNNNDAAAKLIEIGMDVNAANDEGNTPLHGTSHLNLFVFVIRVCLMVLLDVAAAVSGSLAITQMLTFHGALTAARNKAGQTPRILAATKGSRSVAALLVHFCFPVSPIWIS